LRDLAKNKGNKQKISTNGFDKEFFDSSECYNIMGENCQKGAIYDYRIKNY